MGGPYTTSLGYSRANCPNITKSMSDEARDGSVVAGAKPQSTTIVLM